MSFITIKINTDNAAFSDGNWEDEISRILKDLIDSGLSKHYLSDVNGNSVGEFNIQD